MPLTDKAQMSCLGEVAGLDSQSQEGIPGDCTNSRAEVMRSADLGVYNENISRRRSQCDAQSVVCGVAGSWEEHSRIPPPRVHATRAEQDLATVRESLARHL